MPPSLENTNLFKPYKLNKNVTLSHRAVMPPLTRDRCFKDMVPVDLMLQYYDERSRTPGSLLITEGTFISAKAGGRLGAPGLHTAQHRAAWKKIVDKVHANGSYIAVQLWNLGRDSDPKLLKEFGEKFQSASGGLYKSPESEQDAKEAGNLLTEMSKAEIAEMVQQYADVAAKAVEECGFDIVEIHGAHGYLIDQFINYVTNKRTDEYGGSIENRARLVLEIVDAIAARIGADKLALRISPWAQHLGMPGLSSEIHPYVQYGYIFNELQRRNAKEPFAYLSIVEPRVSGASDAELATHLPSNKFVYDIYKGTILRAGNYIDSRDPENYSYTIHDVNENDRTLIAFGRYYISNPDLVERLRKGLPMTPYIRDLFYAPGNVGYNTYGFYGETRAQEEKEKKRLA